MNAEARQARAEVRRAYAELAGRPRHAYGTALAEPSRVVDEATAPAEEAFHQAVEEAHRA